MRKWSALRLLVCYASLWLIGAFLQLAHSQAYPSKPIRMVVGFPPGSGVDALARTIGRPLGDQLGQQIVVDNRSGASGNLASEIVAKSPADGHFLLLTTPSITLNPSLYGKVNFDPVNDFAPIIMIGVAPLILVVHPSLPVASVKDLVALAKSRPGQLAYSSGGNGSAGHLAGELLKSMTGTSIMHIPFKGAPPSMIALIGGELHFTFGSLASALPHVKSGRLKVLAVTSPQRTALMPELPTIAETGVPGYDVTQWYGLLAPAKTPPSITNRINSEVMKALDTAEVKTQLSAQSIEIVTKSDQQFGTFIKTELVKWAKVVKEAGMQVD